jgi:CheY-like chemotaxis protein
VGEKERCLEAGMSDYITKPVLKVTIQKMIEKWVLEQPKTEIQNFHQQNDRGTF